MKSKRLFWLLAALVFGSLITTGILFSDTHPALFWTMEGIAALSLILFVSLYRRLIKPYHILLNGMELLNEQDFSNRLRLVGNDEANRLIEIFHRMMTELKNERLQVRETNRFLDLLIRASPQGVVILDFDERISEINPAGLRLLKINDIETVKGKKDRRIRFQTGRRPGRVGIGGRPERAHPRTSHLPLRPFVVRRQGIRPPFSS